MSKQTNERTYYSRIRVINDDGYDTATQITYSRAEQLEAVRKLKDRGYVKDRNFRGFEFF